jgi:tetratricopeptide (TPR) repeat protein
MKRMLITLSLTLLVTGGHAAAGEADQLFTEGLALIRKNCGECLSATRAGLEDGIDAVETAIELGYDELAGYKALARAHNTLAFAYTRADTEERKAALERLDTVYQRLLELAPNDAEVRVAYARLVHDPAARLEHLGAAVEAAPELPAARSLLALTLIELGNVEAALPHARAAVAIARPDIAADLARQLAQRLDAAGRTADAEQLRATARGRLRNAK